MVGDCCLRSGFRVQVQGLGAQAQFREWGFGPGASEAGSVELTAFRARDFRTCRLRVGGAIRV